MSNSLDLDQARRFDRPDLSPNCLPRLSADNTVDKELNSLVTLLIGSGERSLSFGLLVFIN